MPKTQATSTAAALTILTAACLRAVNLYSPLTTKRKNVAGCKTLRDLKLAVAESIVGSGDQIRQSPQTGGDLHSDATARMVTCSAESVEGAAPLSHSALQERGSGQAVALSYKCVGDLPDIAIPGEPVPTR